MTAGDVQPRRCAIYSDRVALPHGLEAATITVEDGIIARIDSGRVPPPNDIEFVDCGACALLPGLIDVLRGSDVYESAVEGGFSTVVHLPSRFGGPELVNDEPLLCDVVVAGRATSSYIPVVAEVPTLAPCDDVNGATTDETWLQAQVRRGVLYCSGDASAPSRWSHGDAIDAATSSAQRSHGSPSAGRGAGPRDGRC